MSRSITWYRLFIILPIVYELGCMYICNSVKTICGYTDSDSASGFRVCQIRKRPYHLDGTVC